MKKLMALFIAVLMVISVFAFSACGNSNEAEGTIKANYTEINNATAFNDVVEKVENAKLVKKRAETAGGTFKANGEIKVKIGGKSATLNASSVINAILDMVTEEDEKIISGLSAESELSLKTDRGFSETLYNVFIPFEDIEDVPSYEDFLKQDKEGNAALTALENANIEAKASVYIKDLTAYVDGKLTGLPQQVKDLEKGSNILSDLEKGVKYLFNDDNSEIDDLFDAAYDIRRGLLSFEIPEDALENVTFAEVNRYLAMIDAKLSADNSDSGIKIKLASTATTKDKVSALILPELPKEIKDFTISKMDVELYVSLDANGLITAIAGNVDVVVSAKINDTEISVSINGKADISFEVPAKIDYPKSFDGYVAFQEK